MKGSYAGQSFGLDIDKNQEKTLIYLVAGVILFIIAYTLYKGINVVETVTKPVADVFNMGIAKPIVALASGIETVTTVTQNVYNAPQQMYNEAVAGVDKNFNLPQGTYDSYLDSLGIFGSVAKAGTSVLGDSVINTVIQAGQNTRSWFDSIF